MSTDPSRDGGAGGEPGIMLFGVRLTEGSLSSSSFRKSASMNNLSQFEHARDPVAEEAAGYASDEFVHACGRSRERKRGTPWTEEEHRLFLIGLQRVGKGDWRGISRNFVKTRTPTQVASHAQKHFLRQNSHNRRRRRSSLFDITSDAVASSDMEEDHVRQVPKLNQSISVAGGSPTCPLSAAPVSISPTRTSMEVEAIPLTLRQSSSNHGLHLLNGHPHPKTLVRPVPLIPIPPSSKLASLKLNPTSIVDPLPLSLRLPSGSTAKRPSSSTQSSSPAFQSVPPSSLNSSSDSIISVA